MDQPLKTIGNHQIEIRPHSEVQAELLVSVITEGDQAIARVKKKDEESDAIIAELKARSRISNNWLAPAAPPPHLLRSRHLMPMM